MKGWMITAAILCVTGLILAAVGLGRLNFDFTQLAVDQLQEGKYTASPSVKQLKIDVDTCAVSLLPTTEEQCTVEYRSTNKCPLIVTEEEGILSVHSENQRKWYDYIRFFSPPTAVTVYLPAATYEALTVHTDTGAVTVSQDLSFGHAEVHTSTGLIRWNASVTEELRLTASTGHITVEGVSAGQMTLKVSTGHVRITEGTVSGNISVRTSTGRVELTSLSCDKLNVTTSTGDIRLTDLRAAGLLTAEASTGDITLLRADAASLTMTTDTGDVTGSLLSEKIVFAQSDTGRVSVPKTTVGGRCEITTNTGDITITIE